MGVETEVGAGIAVPAVANEARAGVAGRAPEHLHRENAPQGENEDEDNGQRAHDEPAFALPTGRTRR